jgi:hypothetical protein
MFVVAPTIAVFLIALALRVPSPHWAWVLGYVAVTELAFASLALVVASRTRGAATFLIGIVLALGVVLALPFAMVAVDQVMRWPAPPPSGLSGWSALVAATAVGALVLPGLFITAMAGPRRQLALVLRSLAALALSTVLCFQPWLQSPNRKDARARLSTQPDAIRVIDVPGSPGVVALVLDVVPESGGAGDAWRVTVTDGHLTTPEGARKLGGGRGMSDLPPIAAPTVRTVLTVLSAEEHRRLTGARMRLEAIVDAYMERRPTEGTAALAEGATLDTDHSRLQVTHVVDRGTFRNGSLDFALRATEVTLRPAARHDHFYVLRDRETGCEVAVAPSFTWDGRRVMESALLPTLSRPFDAARVDFTARVAPQCDFEAARADIDLRTFEYEHVRPAPFALEFTMPAAGKAFRPAPPAEQVLGPRPLADRNAARQLARLDAGAGREATP